MQEIGAVQTDLLNLLMSEKNYSILTGFYPHPFKFTGGGQNLRTHREVLPVADDFLLLHTDVPFIEI